MGVSLSEGGGLAACIVLGRQSGSTGGQRDVVAEGGKWSMKGCVRQKENLSALKDGKKGERARQHIQEECISL